MIIYSLFNEDGGILRILPFIFTFVSFGPFIGALYWATSLNPRYNEVYSNRCERVRTNNNIEEAKTSRNYLFYGWQIFTIITRLVSLILLCYVFYQHFAEVGAHVKIILFIFSSVLLLILVVNFSLQFACLGSSSVRTRKKSQFEEAFIVWF